MPTENKRVTIPAEIADAIEYLRKDCRVWDDAIILNCFDGGYARTTCCVRQLLGKYAQENPAVLASAIVNGYEREMTEEERAHKNIREYYDRLLVIERDYTGSTSLRDVALGRRTTIEWLLAELKINIAGVNAP